MTGWIVSCVAGPSTGLVPSSTAPNPVTVAYLVDAQEVPLHLGAKRRVCLCLCQDHDWPTKIQLPGIPG